MLINLKLKSNMWWIISIIYVVVGILTGLATFVIIKKANKDGLESETIRLLTKYIWFPCVIFAVFWPLTCLSSLLLFPWNLYKVLKNAK
jgi:hypothetical protein